MEAIADFELLSRYDYPASDYNKAEAIYKNCIEALADDSAYAESLAASLQTEMAKLAAVKSVKKLSGMDALTLILTAGQSLPETIAIYVGVKLTDVPVIWQDVSPELLKSSGSATLWGRIAGTPYPVSIALSVEGKSTAALERLIYDYGALELTGCAAESVAAFNSAMDKAKQVLSNDNSTQLEIDRAKAALKFAKYALTDPRSATLSLKEEPPVIEKNEENPKPGDTPDHSDKPNETPINPKPEQGKSGRIIAAIAAGVVLLAGVVTAGILLMRKKK